MSLDDPEYSRRRALTNVQEATSWGIDRIDQIEMPLDDTYRYIQTGEGVDVLLVDTGVSEHDDVAGRVICGLDTVLLEGCGDKNGHGTAMASVLGGTVFGVAKRVSLVSVKVLNRFGWGRNSQLVKGLDYALDRRTSNMERPMILVLGIADIGNSESVKAGLQALIDAGVTVVRPAGDKNEDACLSPYAGLGITVASTNHQDERCSFSSYGPCVDLFAPGETITAAKARGGSKNFGGTAMAAARKSFFVDSDKFLIYANTLMVRDRYRRSRGTLSRNRWNPGTCASALAAARR